MTPEYPQINKLWCYSFTTKELFSIPATNVPTKPAFLFDEYPEDKLKDLSKTHAITSLSFWSCEDEETLRGYLDGMLPEYKMIELYKRWCRCVVVGEGAENIYKDFKKSWREYETPGDVMVRVSYNGRIVRTQKGKVLPYDPSVCKN